MAYRTHSFTNQTFYSVMLYAITCRCEFGTKRSCCAGTTAAGGNGGAVCFRFRLHVCMYVYVCV